MSSLGPEAEPAPEPDRAHGSAVGDGPALLERAVGYTRGSLQLVAQADPRAPTPCADWDLLALLGHMDDSLAAFTQAAAIGYVDLVPVRPLTSRGVGSGPERSFRGEPADDSGSDEAHELAALLVQRLKGRACALLAAWAHHPGDGPVSVRDRALRSDLLAAAGALEIAVHGWDVARSCGVERPLPEALALRLLEVVPLLVDDVDRPTRFGWRVDVPLHAPASTRLLAALGRTSRQ
jgi:uncharacterized protein (TIGR03086 family)